MADDFTNIRNPKKYAGKNVAFIPKDRPLLGCEVLAAEPKLTDLLDKVKNETRHYVIHRFGRDV